MIPKPENIKIPEYDRLAHDILTVLKSLIQLLEDRVGKWEQVDYSRISYTSDQLSEQMGVPLRKVEEVLVILETDQSVDFERDKDGLMVCITKEGERKQIEGYYLKRSFNEQWDMAVKEFDIRHKVKANRRANWAFVLSILSIIIAGCALWIKLMKA